MGVDSRELDGTLIALRQKLLAELSADGHWTGELSGSALATATAVTALATADPGSHEPLIRRGLAWLADNQNEDGGWGDTVISRSNLPTTLLVSSALAATGALDRYRGASDAAERWLARKAGSLDPRRLAAAVVAAYGSDRTFSAPILMMCALSGRLGPKETAWRLVPTLPFEASIVPHRLLRRLRLPVVSYALPALIAVGLVVHRRRPSNNPLSRAVRDLAAAKALAKLTAIQPESGGFLEAAPLTGFVVMSLIAAGRPDHATVTKGVQFLVASAQDDGSWRIDTDLAVWVTTLSVNALSAGRDRGGMLDTERRRKIRSWLLRRQHTRTHPYTNARAGGWAWTDLPGGVPDADDTAGALLALRALGNVDGQTSRAAAAALRWLVDVQNRDGGVPTFCRGWGRLAFDRSSPDITAHAIAAWRAWQDDVPPRLTRRLGRAIARGQRYLARTQRADGSWAPLWFGNELAPGRQNLTYGTARVVAGLHGNGPRPGCLARAADWLLGAQNPDGGWGGAPDVPSTIEETALAVDALCRFTQGRPAASSGQGKRLQAIPQAVSDGAAYLIRKTDRGGAAPAAPIGLYFARLWYFEKLYPLIFAVSALGRVKRMYDSGFADGLSA